VATLIAGDPGNKLQGSFPYKYLWALFPLPFIAVGACGLLHHWRQGPTVELSPEQKAGELTGGDTGGAPAAGLPTVPEVVTTPGSELSHLVPVRESAGATAVGFLVALLICSGVLTPLASYVVWAVRTSKLSTSVLMSGFCIFFFGLMWVTIAANLFR